MTTGFALAERAATPGRRSRGRPALVGPHARVRAAPFRAGGTVLAMALLLGSSILGGASAHAPAASAVSVMKLYQSSYVPEQGNFTVWLQVSDSSNIQFVYFTFCQLSSPRCYLPISMLPQGSNWYAGTTHPMSTYSGMTEGVRAGYNITIVLNDNSTFTEPEMPNQFTNLSISQSVTGEYMFVMTVNPTQYGLTGVVTDSATGHAVSGAQVVVSPGNATATTSASGTYSFPGLVNGTYTLSVTQPGYQTAVATVAITGSDIVKNIALSTGSSGSSAPAGGGLSATYFGISLWVLLAVIAVIVVGVVAGLVVRGRRSRTAPRAGEGETSGSTPGSGTTGGR